MYKKTRQQGHLLQKEVIMKFLALFILSAFGSSLYAADWSGTVTTLRASNTSNTVLFELSNELDSPARCNEFRMYAIDLDSKGGNAVFELVKYAYIKKIPIEANSLKTCKVHWKSEGVKDIYLK